jgi:hypothetical protein
LNFLEIERQNSHEQQGQSLAERETDHQEDGKDLLQGSAPDSGRTLSGMSGAAELRPGTHERMPIPGRKTCLFSMPDSLLPDSDEGQNPAGYALCRAPHASPVPVSLPAAFSGRQDAKNIAPERSGARKDFRKGGDEAPPPDPRPEHWRPAPLRNAAELLSP